jgi:uncharacterized protein (DUF427 family)
MPTTRAIKFEDGWRTDPVYAINIEPCPKRVRAIFGEEVVADSTQVLTVLEQGHLPVYYFPKGSVRMDLMTASDHSTHCPHKGDASYWTIAAGGEQAENAIWAYDDPAPHVAAIRDHVSFQWGAMHRWLEEDEEVFVHARDPNKRIDITISGREVEVVLGGETVARSSAAMFLFETDLPTRYYLPIDDVRMDLLTASESRTQCPYKGEAVYWNATVGGETWADVVWSYPEPVEESGRIRDHLCFYNEVVDVIRIDGQDQPRPTTKWSRN